MRDGAGVMRSFALIVPPNSNKQISLAVADVEQSPKLLSALARGLISIAVALDPAVPSDYTGAARHGVAAP
jgi:hypothetical protein